MKIVNNKIYIGRGETPTYHVYVIDEQSGTPYIIPSSVKNPVLEFIVRPSIYDRENDFVFKTYLDLQDIKKFDSEDPVEYEKYVAPEESAWDNYVVPSEKDKNRLFRRKRTDKEYDYRYYDETQPNTTKDSRWVPYDFEIKFQFPYEATSLMEAKTYKYEIVLFDANIKRNEDGEAIGLQNIIFKKFLRHATDFIVDGSLSE